MSYQGGQPPGSNGYWAGHGPPNAYGRQDMRQMPPYPHGQPQPSQQYHHPQPQPQVTPNRNQQQWNQNAYTQNGYAMTPGFTPNNYHSQMPSPQIRTPSAPPQFISPAQLYQQSSSSMQPKASQAYQYQQSTPSQPARSHSASAYTNAPRMAPQPQDPPTEKAMLLVSLAEEYFQAAHTMAPAVALSMSSADVLSYEKLIATGLGCLDVALKQVKLAPRMEANIRLRYAGVLFEETENSMVAETCLSKGISLCERNHYYDLKYAMQFMLAQFMAKKNPRAAMKVLDSHINETTAYQHFSWVYVFRLLRASLGMESGTSTDIHISIQNLQAVATLASKQGDYSIHVVASLLETMAYLRTAGPGNMERVQTAIAAAWTNQNSNKCNISQLRALTHILDVVCSYEDGNSDVMLSKLKEMQTMMDDVIKDPAWNLGSETIAIPIRRTAKSSQTVSSDTRMVLDVGGDGGDKLIMSFLSKKEAFAITYLLSGVCLLHKNAGDAKGLKYLQAGLESFEGREETRLSKTPGLLPDLIAKAKWKGEVMYYFRVMMAFCHANAGCWGEMRKVLDDLQRIARKHEIPLTGSLGLYLKYLKGMYYQGTRDLDRALSIYQDDDFKIAAHKGNSITSSAQFERDIGILALLNSLSILQDSSRIDYSRNTAMLGELRSLCVNHPNKDIEIAFNVMSAAVETNPPTKLQDTKDHLRFTLSSAGKTKNTQFLCITLSVMFKRFFSNVVGDQAEKSARSASVQASKNGNPLWRSVADGMLSNCLDVQGKHDEANRFLQSARMFAEKAQEH